MQLWSGTLVHGGGDHLEAFSYPGPLEHSSLLVRLCSNFQHFLHAEVRFSSSLTIREITVSAGAISGGQVILYLAQCRASMSSRTEAASKSSIPMMS